MSPRGPRRERGRGRGCSPEPGPQLPPRASRARPPFLGRLGAFSFALRFLAFPRISLIVFVSLVCFFVSVLTFISFQLDFVFSPFLFPVLVSFSARSAPRLLWRVLPAPGRPRCPACSGSEEAPAPAPAPAARARAPLRGGAGTWWEAGAERPPPRERPDQTGGARAGRRGRCQPGFDLAQGQTAGRSRSSHIEASGRQTLVLQPRSLAARSRVCAHSSQGQTPRSADVTHAAPTAHTAQRGHTDWGHICDCNTHTPAPHT